MAGESPLSFGATVSLSATSVTGNVALPTKTSNQIAVTNLGPDLAYIAFGADSTVTATTAAGYPMLPGTQITFTIAPSLTYAAALTASTTATIKFTAADGYIAGVGAASTGASGGVVDSVNVAQWGGTATTLGQKVMASSVPVVLASDQSIIPVNTPVTKRVTQSPTVSSSPAYVAGDVIGALMTFAGVMRANDITGILQQIYVNCKSAQTAAVDFIAFNANPSASTFTDNGALAVNAADFDKIAGVAHITDWTNLGTPSFAQALNLAIPMTPATGTTTIYGVLVARAGLTLASTTDITVGVKMLDD